MYKKKSTLFPIYFNNPQLLAKYYKRKLSYQFQKVIDSGVFLNGPQNQKFKENLSRYLANGFITTVASGHDALFFAMESLNLGENDEVIFPVNSYPTAFPLALSSAKLTPVDVDKNAQLDVEKFKKAVTSRTKVIVIVHLYGLVGDIKAIQAFCKAKNIFLIEDCAQSFGTYYDNKPIGTFGDIGCFSFYPTKNIGTIGDGGAIWTKHKKLHQFFQQAKSYGEKKCYGAEFVSIHSRLPEIQAAVLNSYFTIFPKEQKKKQNVYNLYNNYLNNTRLSSFIRILSSHPDSRPHPHLFVIECKKRDKLQNFLKDKKIPTMVHYPLPVHLVRAFQFLKFKRGDFPISEMLARRILSLPFHSYLTEEQIAYIAKSMQEFYYA